MNRLNALHYILEVASEKGFTQAKLIDGIYDYSHFNRMCNGKENISIEILIACANKLGLSYNEVFQKMYIDQPNLIKLYENKLDEILEFHEYRKFHSLWEELEQFDLKNESPSLSQLYWEVKALDEWAKGDLIKGLNHLYCALHLTLRNTSIETMHCEVCSTIELRMLTSIAIFEYKRGNTVKAIQILKNMTYEMPLADMDINKGKKIVEAIYFLGVMMLSERRLQDAFYYFDEGIKISLKLGISIFILPLYYHLAILYSIECKEEYSFRLFDICSIVAQLQHKYPLFLEWIHKDVQLYDLKPQLDQRYG